jgi:simple sugar transport system substrate-binding protein
MAWDHITGAPDREGTRGMHGSQLASGSGSGLRSRARKILIATPVVAAALLLAACSSGKVDSSVSSTPSASGSSSSSAAPAASGAVKIFVVGGKSDDPFWSKVKRGADDAAKVVEANGGTVTWLGPQNYDNLGPDAAKLILDAKNQGATAIIGADWVPEAQDQAFSAAVSAGIPIVIYNAGGAEAAKKLKAINYIGNEEYDAGKAGGTYFGSHGAKHVLCVNTLPGTANIEARCKGISDGLAPSGGKSTELPLPSSNFGNPTAISQAIKAALAKDSSIDAVVTISTVDAEAAFAGLTQANLVGKVKLATFDMDQNQLDRIKAGTELFCIDQQPYLQGYLAVSEAYQYNLWGLNIPMDAVLTGPAIIDSANVDATLAGVKAGVR